MAKAPDAFRSISEVSALIGVPQHTLRAWETRFAFVKPVKRPDGRRYYRPSDILVLREVARLSNAGESAEAIRRIFREGRAAPEVVETEAPTGDRGLREALDRLVAARRRLDAVLKT